MSWLVFFAKLFMPNYGRLAKKTQRVQLVTIGFSHYCELAVWCLKVRGIPYDEHSYAPAQHVLAALALRISNKAERYISTSSRTTEVVLPNMSPEALAAKAAREAKIDKGRRSTAVPGAICPEAKVWIDSWDIASKTGLPDIDPTLKKLLDERVGIFTRQLAYHHMLIDRNRNLWDMLMSIVVSGWLWKLLWWLFLGDYTRKVLTDMMKPNHPEAVAACKANLHTALTELDAIISAKRTPFLSGDKIGVADIAVASLMAPVVWPENYYDGKFQGVIRALLLQDEEVRGEVEKMRATPTGRFVMEMYAKHR